MDSRKHEDKLQAAAEVLFRYRGLERMLNKDSSWDPGAPRLFVALSWKEPEKEEYVFDPEKGLRIGYDPTQNDVAVLDSLVSAVHCMLFLYGNRVYVQDLNSTNGTILQRGFRKYRITETVELIDKDRLILGSVTLKVRIRVYQPKY